jgi:hypothetical protein
MKHKRHSEAERLYWKKSMAKWRAKNPQRDREIKRRFREKRRLRLLAEERKAKKKAGEKA